MIDISVFDTVTILFQQPLSHMFPSKSKFHFASGPQKYRLRRDKSG